jgi:hypothetical protein
LLDSYALSKPAHGSAQHQQQQLYYAAAAAAAIVVVKNIKYQTYGETSFSCVPTTGVFNITISIILQVKSNLMVTRFYVQHGPSATAYNVKMYFMQNAAENTVASNDNAIHAT